MIKALLITLLTATLAHAQSYDARTADYLRAWGIGAAAQVAFPTNGLVAYWSMDSVSGNTVEDTFGSNDGTAVGEPLFGTEYGKYLNGVNLNGSSQYISVPNAPSISFGNGATDSPFSVSAWIKMDDAKSFRAVQKYDNSNREWLLGTANDSKLYFYLVDSSLGDPNGHIARYYNTALTSRTGEWINITGVYTAESGGESAVNDISVYLNGVRVDDATSNGAGTYVAIGSVAPLWIGRLSSAYANGSIDEVAIWNRALSSNEVSEIYNNGAGKFYTP